MSYKAMMAVGEKLRELRAKRRRKAVYEQKPRLPRVTRARKRGGGSSPWDWVPSHPSKTGAIAYGGVSKWWARCAYVLRRDKPLREEPERRELLPRPPTPRNNKRLYSRQRERLVELEEWMGDGR